MSDDEGLLFARITIERRLMDDGTDQVWTNFEDRDGEMPPLIEVLGMLEMSKDTALRQVMGEIPDEDDR